MRGSDCNTLRARHRPRRSQNLRFALSGVHNTARLKDPGFPVASPPSRLLSELPGRPSRFLPGGAPRSGRGGPSRRREATRKDPQATRKRPASDPQGLPGREATRKPPGRPCGSLAGRFPAGRRLYERVPPQQERREYRVSAPSTQRGLVFGYGMDGRLGVTTPEEGASDRGGDRPLRLVYSGCDASR